jgi:cystathionine beta-lyase
MAALITPQTKLLWLEAAGSVTLEFPDLLGLVRAARAHPQVVIALDNTWGAGIAFKPFALPQGLAVDVSMHALTKYPSGGGDVLMGSVTTVDPALHLKLQHAHMRLGLGVGGNDAELVLRGLNTMALRYAAQDQAARELALWFKARPEVAAVLHPALPGAPGHSYWRQTCTAAAGLFSVVFHERFSPIQVEAFVDALRLFKIGYSWGGPMSLVMPYEIRSMRSLLWPHQGTLVRFCVGLEALADLQQDCEQALQNLV